MEAVVEQIIKKRTYGSLSEEERNAVKEWCGSEEEFVQMKHFLVEVDGVAASMRTEPNAEIKNSLDNIFAAKHGGIRANWTSPAERVVVPVPAPIIPLHQRTWVRIAAVGLLLLGTATFWNLADHEVTPNDEPVAKLETKEPAVTAVEPGDTAATSKVKAKQTRTTAPETLDGTVTADESVETRSFRALAKPDFAAESAVEDLEQVNAEKEIAVSPGDGAVFIDQLTPSPAAPNFTTLSASSPIYLATSSTFSTIGMNADLHPFDGKNTEATAISMTDAPEGLMDFIVPAF